jgi:hypothetical protein
MTSNRLLKQKMTSIYIISLHCFVINSLVHDSFIVILSYSDRRWRFDVTFLVKKNDFAGQISFGFIEHLFNYVIWILYSSYMCVTAWKIVIYIWFIFNYLFIDSDMFFIWFLGSWCRDGIFFCCWYDNFHHTKMEPGKAKGWAKSCWKG